MAKMRTKVVEGQISILNPLTIKQKTLDEVREAMLKAFDAYSESEMRKATKELYSSSGTMRAETPLQDIIEKHRQLKSRPASNKITSVAARLDGIKWVDAEGNAWTPACMHIDHLLNTILWLERHSLKLEMAYMSMTANFDLFDHEDSMEWLQSTRLYRKMMASVARRRKMSKLLELRECRSEEQIRRMCELCVKSRNDGYYTTLEDY